jgi:subtilisin family serine protease
MTSTLPKFGGFRFVVIAASLALAAVGAAQQSVQAMAIKRQAARAIDQNPNLPYNPYVILVKFKPGFAESDKAIVRSQVGGIRLDKIPSVPGLESISTQIDPKVAADQISRMPWVEYAEPDYTVHASVIPNDPSFGSLWGMNNTGQSGGVPNADIDAPEAWDIFTGSSNTVVAVIDTGIQRTHPDLAANMWTNPNEIAGNGIDDDNNGRIDDTNGWDFVNGDNDPMDDNGHGTHCAGTIGGVGNNGAGVAGVNWNVKLVALKFLSSGGSGSTSNAVLAVDYCRRTGIKISNNSWGGGGFSQSLYDAINNASSIGHIFVAAAGNNGSNNDSAAFYPANYNLNNLIAVASIDRYGNRSSFSNYGATTVDLGAPGSSIVSTVPTDGYATYSGTSMATPHVTGAIALLWGFKPNWTWQQVKDGILSTVRPSTAMNGITVTGGVLNVRNALVAASAGQNTAPTVNISAPANNSIVTQGASVTFTGSADDTQDGNISGNLVWSTNANGGSQIGTGASFSTTSLPLGAQTITARVTDSGGLTGSTSINVTVQAPNTAPTVNITAPSNNATVTAGRSITFTGSASDTQDGNLTSSIVWSSNIDGNIGTGGSFSKSNLTIGTHTITASVTDSGGLPGSASITLNVVANAGPTVTINSPTNGSTVNQGASVSFSGSANDPEDGNVNASLVWSSSRDGQIGTGASFSTNSLSVGVHTITAQATDTLGKTGSASISLEVVVPPNTPPTVQITAPGNGSTFTEGAVISFTGNASDSQDGNVTASLVWTSNLDGQIGTGGSFSLSTLSVGTHTITAVATDSGNLTGNASITVTINQAPATPAAPTNLVGSKLNKTGARLTWTDNSNNETGFIIEREEKIGPNWSGLTQFTVGANVTTFTDNPGPGHYRYRVRAYNAVGASAWTPYVNIKI